MNEDPKDLWRQQYLEGSEMDIERLREQVRAVEARIQRARWLLIVVTLVGVSLTSYLAYSAPIPLLRLGEALLGAGFIICLVIGWRRMSSPSPDTTEACLEFLRKRLAQRRDAVRGGWLLQVAPLVPGLGVSLAALAVAAGQQWSRLTPIGGLLLVWVAAMLIIQSREAAKVDAEIAQLDRLRDR